MKSSYITLILSTLIILVAVLVMVGKKNNDSISSGEYTRFAQCLKDEGAVFYGAWWCPRCNDQKKLFGEGKATLPYVECSLPDRSQNKVCSDLKITGYPTWRFADGSEISGMASLEELATKTTCQLPLANEEASTDDGEMFEITVPNEPSL